MTTQTNVNECSGATDGYAGFASAIEAVISGQFELCVPMERFWPNQRACDPLPPYDWNLAFIRNGSFKMDDGMWSQVVSFSIPKGVAEAIMKHKCVCSGQLGSLHHFHTRAFCVKPDAITPEVLVKTGKSVPF